MKKFIWIILITASIVLIINISWKDETKMFNMKEKHPVLIIMTFPRDSEPVLSVLHDAGLQLFGHIQIRRSEQITGTGTHWGVSCHWIANYLPDENGNRKREANGKNIFWSRGNSWVLEGLARILGELPFGYPKRDFYVKLFREMSAKIASIQQPDGLWRVSMLDPESYPGGEASGSGFYYYALAWGINNGLLDKSTYLPVVKKAWNGLTGLVHKDGVIGWVQPVAADPRANLSAESWEIFGTGAFLLAGSEMIKLSNKYKLLNPNPTRL